MSRSLNPIRLSSIAITATLTLFALSAAANEPSSNTVSSVQREIRLRLPSHTGSPKVDRNHPLVPAMTLAQDGYDHIRHHIHDYSCIMVRRERVNGRLGSHEYIRAKVRHRRIVNGQQVPFSVYMKFLAPAKVKGREVLYVQGRNDNRMIVRNGGQRFAYVTTSIEPTSGLALRDNRHPITEFGVENLFRRLIQLAHDDIASAAETNVKFFENSKVNGRSCTGVHVIHPRKEDSSRFHMVKVFKDNELNIPVHYEAYGWPETGDDPNQFEPLLLEQYTYTKVKLNVGFTDHDFDPNNPQYLLKNRK